MMTRKIQRGRGAERMTHRVQPWFQSCRLGSESSGQSGKGSISARVCDVRPAFALSVAGIVDRRKASLLV